MLGYLSLDIICSSKLTVFLELRSRKTVRFSEQIMSADKYPRIFSRQMETIVYLYHDLQKWRAYALFFGPFCFYCSLVFHIFGAFLIKQLFHSRLLDMR